jgi:uncharacterized protein (DUF1778 family)
MDDKKKQHSVSMRPSEWERLTRAAQAKARRDGPTSSGHVVSTSRFMVEAALKEADKVLNSGRLPPVPTQASLPMVFALKTDE